MREIILDTETTGLDPLRGDKLIEIACVELMNHLPTGKFYHTYVNPERDVPPISTEITGLTRNFLKDHPVFSKVVDEFLEFIQDSPLVIHNADFDLKFLNVELTQIQKEPLRNPVVDTLYMARKKFPGSPASLDALCRRFKIDLSNRTKHGALIDCELLSGVYLELRGGRQQGLSLGKESKPEGTALGAPLISDKELKPSRNFSVSEEEKQKHAAFVKTLLK
jgi:DNA polymerase-3 subunit epsilon